MLSFVMMWTSAILFCGLVFRGEDCIWPLRAFYYVMPLKWVFNSAAWDIYMPAEYPDAENCVYGVDPACTALGYKCPALSSLECFGHTGAQVLDTLSYSYDTLGSKDERWFDILLALAFALLMKFLYAVGLMISVQATAPLKIPKATSTTIVEEKQVNAA